jgi:hypothetical protein
VKISRSHCSELRGRTVHKRRALAIPLNGSHNNFSFGLADVIYLFWWRQAFAGCVGLGGQGNKRWEQNSERLSPRGAGRKMWTAEIWRDVLAFYSRGFPLCFGTIGRQYTRASCV